MATIASLVLVLSGCCLPKLEQPLPGAPLPGTFNGASSSENSSQICWQDFFSDPTLTSLINQALIGNQELKILTQEVKIANYGVLARKGAYLPFAGLRARAGLDKPSKFTPLGAAEDQLQPIPGKNFPEPLPNFLIAAEFSWEIDIWRKLRNARDAQTLRFLGTQEGQNYMVTRMVAEVAENYFELMALDNRMDALNRTIEIQERSLEASRAMKEAGRGTELAVQRFQAEVRKNQSERMIIQQQIVEVENEINFTLGRYPQRVERMSANFLNLTLGPLSIGAPAQLMQNRADIRQAERELAAAGLEIKVARARFYPSVNLSGDVGYEAFNTRYLFQSPESLIYGVAGDLVQPLLNRRAIQADYLTANALQLEKLYEYQRKILNAFTEVVNRLAKVQNYGNSIEIKRQQLQSLEASVENATGLFQANHPGIEYMDVLFAQRDLMDAKMVLIETKQQQLAAVVNAYQALGGGAVAPGVYQQGILCNPTGACANGGNAPCAPPGSGEMSPTPANPESPQPEVVPAGPMVTPPATNPPAENNGNLQALPPIDPLANAGSPRYR